MIGLHSPCAVGDAVGSIVSGRLAQAGSISMYSSSITGCWLMSMLMDFNRVGLDVELTSGGGLFTPTKEIYIITSVKHIKLLIFSATKKQNTSNYTNHFYSITTWYNFTLDISIVEKITVIVNAKLTVIRKLHESLISSQLSIYVQYWKSIRKKKECNTIYTTLGCIHCTTHIITLHT